MSRINDLPGPIAAQSGDTVVGTDKTDSNKTVKFTVDSIAALATGSSVALLDDIGNVNTSSKSDGQVLSWNESEGEWRATTVSGSGATALPDLTDVADDATSSASPGDVLAWDTSSGGEWQSQATSLVIAPETLNGLDDVNLSVVSDGEFLQYNNTAGKWENSTLDLSKLDDISLSALADEQFLRYNTGTSKWENFTLGLNGLDDVNLSVVSDGQFLEYDTVTNKWQNSALDLSKLDDVSLSTLTDGQFLEYDSTAGKFLNRRLGLNKLEDVDTSGVAKGDILVYDGTSEFTPTRQKVNLNASLVGYDASLSHWLNSLYSLSVDDGLTITGQMLLNVAFVIPSDLDDWRIEKFKISAYQTNATSSSEVALTLTKNNTIIDAGVALTFTGDGSTTGALVKQTATYPSPFITVSEDDVIGIAGLDSPTPTNLTEFQQVVISIKLIPPA